MVIAEEPGLPIELIILGGGALIAAGFGVVYVGGRRGGPAKDAKAKAEQVTIPVVPIVATGFKPAASGLASEPVTAPVTAPVNLGVTALSRQPIGGRRPVGYHEMLAERGPSADNPFLTRKNRLRRARFYDRQESDFAVPPRIGAAGR